MPATPRDKHHIARVKEGVLSLNFGEIGMAIAIEIIRVD